MANGKTAVELWRNGEIVDGKNKILEEDTTTVSTIAPTDLQPSNNNVNNVAISPTPIRVRPKKGYLLAKNLQYYLISFEPPLGRGIKLLLLLPKTIIPIRKGVESLSLSERVVLVSR